MSAAVACAPQPPNGHTFTAPIAPNGAAPAALLNAGTPSSSTTAANLGTSPAASLGAGNPSSFSLATAANSVATPSSTNPSSQKANDVDQNGNEVANPASQSFPYTKVPAPGFDVWGGKVDTKD
jgi:hypothetical protein